MKIEKVSDGEFRWKVIFCENWCFTKTTEKVKIKETHDSAEYTHKNGVEYLSVNGDKPRPCKIYAYPNGHMRVIRL